MSRRGLPRSPPPRFAPDASSNSLPLTRPSAPGLQPLGPQPPRLNTDDRPPPFRKEVRTIPGSSDFAATESSSNDGRFSSAVNAGRRAARLPPIPSPLPKTDGDSPP